MPRLRLNAAGKGICREEARGARSWLTERRYQSQGKDSCQNLQCFAPKCCTTGAPQARAMEEGCPRAATLALNKHTQFKDMPSKELSGETNKYEVPLPPAL